jgi:hypothetical protein
MLGFYALGSAPLGSAGGGGAVYSDQITSLSASAVGGVIRPVSAYSSSVLTASVAASVAKTLTSDQQTGASASLTGGVIRPLSSSQYTALTASLAQDQGGAASTQYSDVAAALVGGVIRPIASDQASTVGAVLSGGVIRSVASSQYTAAAAVLSSTAIKSVSAYQSSVVSATLTGGTLRRMYTNQYSSVAASLVSSVKNFSLAIATQGAVIIEWQRPATYISWGSVEDIMVPLQIVEGNKAPKIITLYVVDSDTGYAALNLTGCSGYAARARKIDESTGYPAGASVAIAATLYGTATNGQIQLDYSSSGLTAGIWEMTVHFTDGAAYQHVYGPATITVAEPIPAP